MARGFLSGAIWGTVLSVGGLGAASVFLPERPEITPPSMPDQVAEAPQPADDEIAPDAPEGEADAEAEAPEAEPAGEPDPNEPDTEQAPSSEPVDPGAEPASDVASSDPETGVQDAGSAGTPPVVMETGTESTQTAEPASSDARASEPARRPGEETAVSPDADVPTLQSPEVAEDTAPAETEAAPVPTPDTGEEIAALDAPTEGEAPEPPSTSPSEAAPNSAPAPDLAAPESEARLNIVTEPAQPPVPVVPDAESALASDAPGDEDVPQTETQTGNEDVPQTGTPAENEAATGTEPATDEDALVVDDTPEPADRPQVRRLVPETPVTDETPAETDSAALSRPSIGTPATSLTDRTQANSTRLPSIGGNETSEDGPTDAAPNADDQRPPLERFAAEVQIDPSLPKMSIVLIDDGTGPLGPDTLDGFPFPVTFALDPGRQGAAERMDAYRAAGYEVAALVDLPEAAQPTDVEQILAGAVAAVPEAVALIEAPGGGLQSGRETTEQATSFAAESGHGLVFLPNGLNTAQAIAERENVPSASILRDFDGDGQDARTKRRFLDGAAFRARQDGSVVMLGRLTPDTLSALVLWSLQDRAASVAMVPVSTILTSE